MSSSSSLILFKNFALFGSDELDVDILYNQKISKNPDQQQKPLPYSASVPRHAVLVHKNIIAAIGTEQHCQAKASELQSPDEQLQIVDGNEYLQNDDATGDPLPPTLSPGFIDSHAHLLDGGGRLSYVLDMKHVMSKEQFSQSIVSHIEKLYGEGAADLNDNSVSLEDREEEWVFGSGWDDEYFGGLPHKSWIDIVEPARPVFLYRCDLHTALMNSAGLKFCNIDRDTPQPPGGVIEHDEDGEPNGLLREGAVMEFARSNFPKTTKSRLKQALKAGTACYHSSGVTCVHDMTTLDVHTNVEEYNFYKNSYEAGRLNIRMRTALRVHEVADAVAQGVIRPDNKDYFLAENKQPSVEKIEKKEGEEGNNNDDTATTEKQQQNDHEGGAPKWNEEYEKAKAAALAFPAPNSTHQNQMIRLCFLKMFSDGSLGSRTARMHQPYAPRRGECYSDQYKTDNRGCSCGVWIKTYDDLSAGIKKAREHCLLPCMHAIGDAAVTTCINAFKESEVPAIQLKRTMTIIDPETDEEKEHPYGYDCPFGGRIEHCQHIAARDLPRLKEGNIIASVQPLHMASDAVVSERVLGHWRRPGAFPLASLMRQHKVHMVFGSDWPVVSLCPGKGTYAAVTRRSHWEEMPLMNIVHEENPSGSSSWDRRQCLTMREALYNFTAAAAESCPGDKNFLGRLRVGFAADFTILSPMVTRLMIMKPEEVSAVTLSSPAEILNDERKVFLETWVDGKQVFKRQHWTD